MPSSILSHQAPGLALKTRFPKKFDGIALCLGTFIPDLNFIFSRLVLDLKGVRRIFREHLKILKKADKFEEAYSNDFREAILKALDVAQKKGHSRIEMGDLLTALAEHDLVFKRILIDLKQIGKV